MYLAYYLKAGKDLDYLLNVDYFTKLLLIGCMLGQYELERDESIALNPFIKKK